LDKIREENAVTPATKEEFDLTPLDDLGVLIVGGPERAAEKILRHGEASGGISIYFFQMDNAGLTHIT